MKCPEHRPALDEVDLKQNVEKTEAYWLGRFHAFSGDLGTAQV